MLLLPMPCLHDRLDCVSKSTSRQRIKALQTVSLCWSHSCCCLSPYGPEGQQSKETKHNEMIAGCPAYHKLGRANKNSPTLSLRSQLACFDILGYKEAVYALQNSGWSLQNSGCKCDTGTCSISKFATTMFSLSSASLRCFSQYLSCPKDSQ